MTSLIIIQESATRSHSFVIETTEGRKATINVEALKDVSVHSVLRDLKSSSLVNASESNDDVPGIVLFFMFSVLLALFLAIGTVVGDIGGFITTSAFSDAPLSTWPTWIPFASGETVGKGCVRFWLLISAIFGVLQLLVWQLDARS